MGIPTSGQWLNLRKWRNCEHSHENDLCQPTALGLRLGCLSTSWHDHLLVLDILDRDRVGEGEGAIRITTYLIGGPFDGQLVSTSAEDMRIVPPAVVVPWERNLKMIAAKYKMKETSVMRDPLKGRMHGQAAHQFRGYMETDSLLVTDVFTPNDGVEWPEEVP